MMLHRHFGNEGNNENMTKLRDVSRPDEGDGSVSGTFPNNEDAERPKRKRRKTE